MNFLEQLIAEWYAYQDYLVLTNINVGKRPKGGYEGEIDIIAFDPKKKSLFIWRHLAMLIPGKSDRRNSKRNSRQLQSTIARYSISSLKR